MLPGEGLGDLKPCCGTRGFCRLPLSLEFQAHPPHSVRAHTPPRAGRLAQATGWSSAWALLHESLNVLTAHTHLHSFLHDLQDRGRILDPNIPMQVRAIITTNNVTLHPSSFHQIYCFKMLFGVCRLHWKVSSRGARIFFVSLCSPMHRNVPCTQ